jgi:hypothetical protein
VVDAYRAWQKCIDTTDAMRAVLPNRDAPAEALGNQGSDEFLRRRKRQRV